MSITALTDTEASELIGVNRHTIRNAVKYGVLTRVPSIGRFQRVAKEQVLLFKGKSQMRLQFLSKEEMQQWTLIKTSIEQASAQASFMQEVQAGKTQFPIQLDRSALEYLDEKGYLAPFSQAPLATSAPASSTLHDSIMQALHNPALVVLVGLIILFYKGEDGLTTWERIEPLLTRLDLTPDDISLDQREKIVTTLIKHPREREAIECVLREEKLIA